MKKLTRLIVIIIFSAAAMYSQSMDSIIVQNGTATYKIRIEMLMSPVLLKLNNATVKRGMLYRITDDSVYLSKNQKVESIAYTDIAMLLLTSYSNNNKASAIYGAAAGFIAGSLITQLRDDAVPFYSSSFIERTVPAIEVVFALLGASIGYLYESATNENTYIADFTSKDSFQRVKQKFIEKLTESVNEPKYKISLSSSYVYSNRKPGDGSYLVNEEPPINMFRKISVTRLMPDNLEAGLMFVNLNERPFYSYTWTGRFEETYSGYGVFAYCGYNYYPIKDSKDLNLNAGLGLGVTSVNYNSSSNIDEYYEQDGNYFYRSVILEEKINKKFFSLDLSAKLEFTLIDKLRMGIEYDNVIIPGQSKPGIRNMQLEEDPLGNSSLGIILGLNF